VGNGPETTEPAARPEALCTTCFKPIDPRAKKCTGCDSYQDWRRHLSMSGSVLALLVALVSVIALATPMIQAALAPKDSKLHFTVQGVAHNQIYIMVSNSGTRPGSVTGLAINRGFGTLADMRLDPMLIKPGDARQIVRPIPPAVREDVDRFYMNALRGKYEPANATLWINYADFSGANREVETQQIKIRAIVAGGETPWHECVTGGRVRVTNRLNGKSVLLGTPPEKCPSRPPYVDKTSSYSLTPIP
jgi:hypothetical protein